MIAPAGLRRENPRGAPVVGVRVRCGMGGSVISTQRKVCMRAPTHLVRAGRLVRVLALVSSFVCVTNIYAGTSALPPNPIAAGQQEQVQVADDGSLGLWANAPPAPAVYGSFLHFGFSISPAISFTTSFRTINVNYEAHTPPGS